MTLAKHVSAGLAAIVLVASAALPASAHGDIRRERLYLQDGQIVGGLTFYCDGHTSYWGNVYDFDDVQVIFYECP